jgi:hypothetical protein
VHETVYCLVQFFAVRNTTRMYCITAACEAEKQYSTRCACQEKQYNTRCACQEAQKTGAA